MNPNYNPSHQEKIHIAGVALRVLTIMYGKMQKDSNCPLDYINETEQLMNDYENLLRELQGIE